MAGQRHFTDKIGRSPTSSLRTTRLTRLRVSGFTELLDGQNSCGSHSKRQGQVKRRRTIIADPAAVSETLADLEYSKSQSWLPLMSRTSEAVQTVYAHRGFAVLEHTR